MENGQAKLPVLGGQVTIKASGETGEVIGRAHYLTSEPNNLLRYKRADGVATEGWWPDSALEVAPTPA
jgi:hypothetical protein